MFVIDLQKNKEYHVFNVALSRQVVAGWLAVVTSP